MREKTKSDKSNNRDSGIKAGLLCLGGPLEFDRWPYRGCDQFESKGDDGFRAVYDRRQIRWNSPRWSGTINVWVLDELSAENQVIALGKADNFGLLEERDFDPVH